MGIKQSHTASSQVCSVSDLSLYSHTVEQQYLVLLDLVLIIYCSRKCLFSFLPCRVSSVFQISFLFYHLTTTTKKKKSMKKALVQSFGDHVFYLYVFCFLCHFYSRCPRHFNCGMEKTSGLEQCCRR